MKKELIWCHSCGKYATRPCGLTRDSKCPLCGSWDLYEISADPEAENYFIFDTGEVLSIDDLRRGYDNYKDDINNSFDISTFEEFMEIETDMGGDLVAARFTGEL